MNQIENIGAAILTRKELCRRLQDIANCIFSDTSGSTEKVQTQVLGSGPHLLRMSLSSPALQMTALNYVMMSPGCTKRDVSNHLRTEHKNGKWFDFSDFIIYRHLDELITGALDIDAPLTNGALPFRILTPPLMTAGNPQESYRQFYRDPGDGKDLILTSKIPAKSPLHLTIAGIGYLMAFPQYIITEDTNIADPEVLPMEIEPRQKSKLKEIE